MSRFGMTGKIAAKADRERDPFEYIDDIRQEIVEINEWRESTDKCLRILEACERDRLTATGAWTMVKGKLNERTVKLGSKFIHWVLAAVGTGTLCLITLLFKFAWKGLHVVGP